MQKHGGIIDNQDRAQEASVRFDFVPPMALKDGKMQNKRLLNMGTLAMSRECR